MCGSSALQPSDVALQPVGSVSSWHSWRIRRLSGLQLTNRASVVWVRYFGTYHLPVGLVLSVLSVQDGPSRNPSSPESPILRIHIFNWNASHVQVVYLLRLPVDRRHRYRGPVVDTTLSACYLSSRHLTDSCWSRLLRPVLWLSTGLAYAIHLSIRYGIHLQHHLQHFQRDRSGGIFIWHSSEERRMLSWEGHMLLVVYPFATHL